MMVYNSEAKVTMCIKNYLFGSYIFSERETSKPPPYDLLPNYQGIFKHFPTVFT